jgi:ERCC4-type nuclease
MMCRVEIDDRERNPELINALARVDGVKISRVRLETGDFRVDGSVLIERKTAADFGRSLIDGRLFSQAVRLANSTLRTALILEGDQAEWEAVPVSDEALQGACISLSLVFDIPLLFSNGPGETARLLVYAAGQLQRARLGGQIPSRKTRAKRRSTRQLRILQALPEVGPKRARWLLEHFGSVRACFNAEPAELAAVDGISRKTARLIAATVR